MTLAILAPIAIDILAIAVLVGALYAPRHGRRDLVAAYIGVNIGVLAVTFLLASAEVSAGLGLGLFGVLSIIRLRSTALAQGEVAYFFAALALGLLGGTGASVPITAALMAFVVASLWIGDHPALMRRSRNQVVTLDRAITDENEVGAELERVLGAEVRSFEVQRLDLVTDTTVVDVRFKLRKPQKAGAVDTTSGGSVQPLAEQAPKATTAPQRPRAVRPAALGTAAETAQPEPVLASSRQTHDERPWHPASWEQTLPASYTATAH